MFNIKRPEVADGSLPSEIERTLTRRSRRSWTVASTSSSDRPSRSIRHTTTVSPSLAYLSNSIMAGRCFAWLEPEVTSENGATAWAPVGALIAGSALPGGINGLPEYRQ